MGAGIIAAAVSNIGAALQLSNARDLPATRSARQRTMGMQWIADINRIGNVEELPAVRRLDAVVTSKIEGVDGGRPVRLTIGIRADDAQGFLQCVVCLNGVVASMPTPGHLHRVVVSIEIVGGLVQIAIAISRHRIIQWAVKLRISVSRVRSAQYRPKRDQVEIASETAAACQVPASVPYIGNFHKALPRRSLRDGEAVAIGIRLPVVLGINCRGRSR